MEEYKISLINNITGMIASPGQAIEKIGQKPYIEEAVLIVGICAILSGINAYFAAKKFIYDYSDFDAQAVEIMKTITPIITIIGAIIGVIIIWIIAAGVVHVIGIALGGEGKFTQMLVIYGYAYIPVIFSLLISMILMSFVEPVTIAITASGTPPDVMNVLMSNPYYQGSIIITYLMKLWSLGLVFLGVKYVHNLTSGRALIAVSIPLLFMIGGIVMMMFSKLITGMFVK
jgi:hypothetical protein